MARINVYQDQEFDDGKLLVGWFDPDTATRFDQDTRWNGHNMVGVITGSEFIDEYLYRTKGGRWILNHDATRYHNGPDDYEFVTDAQARDWLLRSECNDEAIERYFGELEEEKGPGRPPIGALINVRFPADLLARIDKVAEVKGMPRAKAIRMLVTRGLSGMLAA